MSFRSIGANRAFVVFEAFRIGPLHTLCPSRTPETGQEKGFGNWIDHR